MKETEKLMNAITEIAVAEFPLLMLKCADVVLAGKLFPDVIEKFDDSITDFIDSQIEQGRIEDIEVAAEELGLTDTMMERTTQLRAEEIESIVIQHGKINIFTKDDQFDLPVGTIREMLDEFVLDGVADNVVVQGLSVNWEDTIKARIKTG